MKKISLLIMLMYSTISFATEPQSMTVTSKSAYKVEDAATATIPAQAEFGNLITYSSINQPLNAEIEILNNNLYNISIAAKEVFEARGLIRDSFLDLVSLNIIQKDNKNYISLTSKEKLINSFMDLVLNIDANGLTQVKEFIIAAQAETLSITPPQVAPTNLPTSSVEATSDLYKEQPKPMAAVKNLPTENLQAVPPTPSEPQKPTEVKPDVVADKPVQPSTTIPDSTIQEYVVKKGDTLSKIARKLNLDVDKARVISSLFLENQHAFHGKNMNFLLPGKTLAIPSIEKMQAYSKTEISKPFIHNIMVDVSKSTPLAQENKKQSAAGKITKAEPKPIPEVKKEGKDVLKLSHADGKKKKTAEEKINEAKENATAQDAALAETQARIKMLEKQLEDLNKLSEMYDAKEAAAKLKASGTPVEEKKTEKPIKQKSVEKTQSK